MYLKLKDVKKLSFETWLKTYLLKQSMMSDKERDRWCEITPRAEDLFKTKVQTLQEATIQLILRSNFYALIKSLVTRGKEEDLRVVAELGGSEGLRALTFVQREQLRPVISLLVTRTDEFGSSLSEHIVESAEDLRDLYERVKDKHKEVVSKIAEDKRCPADVFVEIVNQKIKEPGLSISPDALENLEAKLGKGEIEVVRRKT